MTISIPDTLNVNSSEKYIMSIRLKPGGLSFSAHNPTEAQSFFFRDVEFDDSIPYKQSLKEIFFSNDCLIWNYKRTKILCLTQQYTLAPNECADSKKRSELLAYNFFSPDKRILANSLDDEQAELVFAINEDVYEFCLRSLTNPIFIHHITSQIIMFKKQCRGEKYAHMFAIVRQSMVDICCFSNNSLLFANTFTYEQTSDFIYYLCYVWKQVGLDQLNDRLSISGDTSVTNKALLTLHTFIRHVDSIEIPAKAYFLGGEILQAPVDLILMSVCE
ncbi:MAG: DUF3822 family protein [Tannerellaceae bacterium]|nr:DUF3822 family protein [Tannerellaceae bacterium]